MEVAHVAVQLVPRASRDEVAGFESGGEGEGKEVEVLRVRVTAPPVGGRANAALTRLLAKRLRVARGDVRVVAGQSSRRKVVAVDGLGAGEVRRRLG